MKHKNVLLFLKIFNYLILNTTYLKLIKLHSNTLINTYIYAR